MRRPQPYVDRQAMKEEALKQALKDDYQIKPIMINTRQHYDQDEDYYLTHKERRPEYEKHEFYDSRPDQDNKAKSRAKLQSEDEGLQEDELQEAQAEEMNEAEQDETAEEQIPNEENAEAQGEEATPAEEAAGDETPAEETPAEEAAPEPAEEVQPQAEEQCEGEEQTHEECLEEECTKETIEKGEEEPKKVKKQKPKPRPKIEDYSDAELGRLVRLRFSRQRHPIRRTFEDSSTNRPSRTNTMNNVDDVCFYAYEECNYAGRAIRLCGRFPTIPPQLSRMVVRSLQIPRHTRIEFYSHNNYGGEMQSFIGSNRCLINPFTLNNLVRN